MTVILVGMTTTVRPVRARCRASASASTATRRADLRRGRPARNIEHTFECSGGLDDAHDDRNGLRLDRGARARPTRLARAALLGDRHSDTPAGLPGRAGADPSPRTPVRLALPGHERSQGELRLRRADRRRPGLGTGGGLRLIAYRE